MATVLCHVNVVSRGKARSAIAAAAYRAGEKIKSEYSGKTHDYSKRTDVVYTEILTPENAPSWMKNRPTLWNGVEKSEIRKDTRLARQIEIALPRELSHEQNIQLLREYAEMFVDMGMVADLSYHDKKDGNPHSHIMFTTRIIDGEQFGKKCRAWDKRENVELWRQWYANLVNKYLNLNGFSQRIDHRSFERQGLEKKPTERLHRKVYEKEKKGVRTPQGDRNRQIMEDNRQREQIQQELEKLKQDKHLAELEQAKEQRAEPHHEVNFEDRYIRPKQPSYSERYRQATEHYKLAKDDNTNFEDRYKTRKQIPVPETKTPYEAKFENKRKQAEISKESMEYEERKQQRKYVRTPERTIHQEYEIRKLEERYNQPPHHKRQHQERTPEPQPKPHHEVEFEDRYKRPKRPPELEKNKDDDKTHDR